jgi:hypothetical protein
VTLAEARMTVSSWHDLQSVTFFFSKEWGRWQPTHSGCPSEKSAVGGIVGSAFSWQVAQASRASDAGACWL